jgi:agmatine deiminase
MLRRKMTSINKTMPTTPAQLGYSFPAEWEKHEATWLGWPHNASDWPGKFEIIPWVYGEMVRKISAGEKINLIVRHKKDEAHARHIFKHVGLDLRKIKFVTHSTNRGWTRDTGPIFVKRNTEHRSASSSRAMLGAPAKSETAIVHFHFNGWAKYDNWRKDTKVPETAAKLLGKKLFHAEYPIPSSTQNSKLKTKNFVIEGGGIELNGLGTLISPEECYLDPKIQVRNPGLG